MRLATAILLMVLASLSGPAAPVTSPADLAGSWEGVIRFPEVSLRMRFEFTREAGGGLNASMDSIDQGARDIPVESVGLEGNRVHLVVKVANSSFEGEVNEAANYITGQWRQGSNNPVPLDLEKMDPAKSESGPALSPEELAAAVEAGKHFCGVWDGIVARDQKTNTLRVKIWRAQNGVAKGNLDSVEQQIVNLPLRSIRYRDGHIRFEARGLGASFEGVLQPGSQSVSGAWHQADLRTPLNLEKAPPPR